MKYELWVRPSHRMPYDLIGTDESPERILSVAIEQVGLLGLDRARVFLVQDGKAPTVERIVLCATCSSPFIGNGRLCAKEWKGEKV